MTGNNVKHGNSYQLTWYNHAIGVTDSQRANIASSTHLSNTSISNSLNYSYMFCNYNKYIVRNMSKGFPLKKEIVRIIIILFLTKKPENDL